MKILQINTVRTGRNGISGVVFHLLDAFPRGEQDRLDYLAQEEPDNPAYRRAVEERGGRFFVAKHRRGRILGYFFSLFRLCRGYDAVHVHGNSGTMAIEMAAAWFAGVPVRVAHSHSTSCTHRRMDRLLRPFLYLFCNRRLACGEDAARWLWRRRRATVLHNGIQCDRFAFSQKEREEIRAELGILPEERLLLHIGSFDRNKNQAFLLDLLSDLRRTDSRFRLLLIGDGETRERVCGRAREAGLENAVLIPGETDCTAACLSAADLFLLPSLYEGLPLVLVEAQASGLPCLVSDTVSSAADLTGTVTFLPLDRPDGWRTAVLAHFAGGFPVFERAASSLAARSALEGAGYDISRAAATLTEIYRRR